MSAALVGDSPAAIRPLYSAFSRQQLHVCTHASERMWRAKQARLSHRVGSLSLRLCCPLPIAQLTCRRRQVSSARKSPPTVFLECSRVAFVACNFAVADWRCTMLFSLVMRLFTRIGAHVQMRREDSAVVALQQSN